MTESQVEESAGVGGEIVAGIISAVITLGCSPVRSARRSAGRPKLSQPITRSTLKPIIRFARATTSVAV